MCYVVHIPQAKGQVSSTPANFSHRHFDVHVQSLLFFWPFISTLNFANGSMQARVEQVSHVNGQNNETSSLPQRYFFFAAHSQFFNRGFPFNSTLNLRGESTQDAIGEATGEATGEVTGDATGEVSHHNELELSQIVFFIQSYFNSCQQAKH